MGGSNRKRGELVREILLIIATGVIIPAALVLPNLPLVLKPFLKSFSQKHRVRKDNVLRSLRQLKKNRLIKIIEKNGQQILSLTEDGKKRVLSFDLDNIKIKQPKKWDGYWRVIIFDIPESQKKGRDALNQKLKEMGFYGLQKSCFIYPFECYNEIEFVSEFFGVMQHIQFILAKKITNEDYLKQYFGID